LIGIYLIPGPYIRLVYAEEHTMKPKHLTYLLIAAIGAVSIVSAFADGASQDSPIAFIPDKTYEFKTVPEGTQVTHTFKIQNTGTAPLLIVNVKTA
jgi:uncharacterized protein DUF1573